MSDWLTRKKTPAGSPRVEPTIGNVYEYSDVSSSDRVKMLDIFGSADSNGAVVNSRTAMRVSVVYACVRMIAGSIARLRIPVYKRDGSSREEIEGHPFNWLFNESPTANFSAAAFWEYMLQSILLRGDGLAYIQRTENGQVLGFIPVPRDDVYIRRSRQIENDPRSAYKLTYGVKTYDADGNAKLFAVEQEDMLHFPGQGFDGECSPSVISYAARQAIGNAMRGDEFAGQFYGSGANPQHAIEVPGKMDTEAQERLRSAFVAKYSGRGLNGIPLVLTDGIKVSQLSLTPVDAQLLESRQFEDLRIAQAFGVPPHMVGMTDKATSWGTGIEQLGIGFVLYTLGPHLNRIEQELNRKLWPRSLKYFAAFDTESLMRGDSKTTADFFSKALGGPGAQGWMKLNEVRKKFHLPPVPDGDRVAMAGATAPQTAQEPTA